MNQVQVFAVHDAKAEAFLEPFFAMTRGQAVRQFVDSVNNPQHGFAKHPEDYVLFHIGEYDVASGKLSSLERGPHPLGNGVEFLTGKE